MNCKHSVTKIDRSIVHRGWLLLFGDCVYCGDHCVMVVNSEREIWDGANDPIEPDGEDFSGDSAEWSW